MVTYISIVKTVHTNLNALKHQPHKMLNTLKQFVGKLPTNCLNVFDYFVGLTLKGFKYQRN